MRLTSIVRTNLLLTHFDVTQDEIKEAQKEANLTQLQRQQTRKLTNATQTLTNKKNSKQSTNRKTNKSSIQKNKRRVGKFLQGLAYAATAGMAGPWGGTP